MDPEKKELPFGLDEKELKTKYDLFDVDKSTTIPASEIHHLLDMLIPVEANPTGKKAAKIISPFVTTKMKGEGFFVFDEFIELLEYIEQDLQRVGLREAFKTLARSCKKGKKGEAELENMSIDFKVVKTVLQMYAPPDEPFDEAQLDQMVKEADTDGNGSIEIDEFVEYIMSGSSE